MKFKFTKSELSWILYDVANSAFILIITATLPIYFRTMAEGAGIDSDGVTALWGTATSLSLIALAILSPLLGALGDYKGNKRKLFSLFLGSGILAAFGFTFANQWQAFLILFILSRLAYAACNIFYDGMLVDVTDNKRMDAISSWGYAYGYVGSTIPFIVGVILIFFAENIGLDTLMATKISFLIVIVWWALLSIPLLKNVKQVHYLEHQPNLIKSSFKRVIGTMKDIRKSPKILYFILAYFFYIDGVYTIISMATSYGGEVGIGANQMLMALLLTQFVAFPFAILSIKFAASFGTLKVIKAYVVMYMFIALFGFFLAHAWQFWVLAVLIGMAQGGVQSLSRSYFGQMVPKEKSNEYFGFFDIFGKFADFMGPLIIALSSVFFGSSKYGVLCLIGLFLCGYLMLKKVEKHALPTS